MKRILKAASAVLLALGLLAGCASRAPNRGTINGSVYASSDAKLVFVAPLGWRYFSDAEISAFKEYYIDNLRSAGIYVSSERFEKAFVFDMIAVDTGTGTSVTVFYEDLSSIPGWTNYTEDSYLDAYKENEKKDPLFDFEFGDYTDETIGANTYRMVPYTDRNTGFNNYLYVRRFGGYMLEIMVTITYESDLDAIMANFSWTDVQTE